MRTSTGTGLHRATLRQWLLAACCTLLLAVQAIGLVHAVAHGGGHAESALFGGHDEGDSQCRLFDQAAHADAVGATPAALPLLPVAVAVRTEHPGSVHAAQAAGYLARGPPWA